MSRRIGMLVFDGVQVLDATGPLAAFEIAARYQPDAYGLEVRARSGGAVTSSSGARLLAEPLGPPEGFDTVIVAGGDGTREAMADAEVLAWTQAAAASARRIASVCSGAFVLAAAGLLDGRRATTHWSRAADLARRFPAVRVEPDRIFVRDGAVWTSAGITAGIDLALALIAEDLGEALARDVARQLVVFYRRPGGQSQFSALAELGAPDGRFAGLLAWARETLAADLSVEALARRCAMSPRNFARAFTAETGITPAKAVERLRVEAARTAVEAGGTLEPIAVRCGFSDAEHMRRAFARAFGTTPQAMRRLGRLAA
jgi:transcriptional regulator GlxA family with amidase domain